MASLENSRVNPDSRRSLQVSNLSVKRSGALVIKDIDLSIKQGEFVGLVGPNGSGKTTLILTILGILKPFTGDVKIYG